MSMWLTNIGSFWINSTWIGHSAGIVGIINGLWNMKSILVKNLFWVTWSPSVSRWRVPFCFTSKSYTLLYNNNNILRLKITNLGWICTSNWKIKNQIKKQHLHKDTSEWLVFNSTARGPTLPAHLYTRGYSLFSLMFFRYIHSHWFANHSPSLCIVVSMKLLFRAIYRCILKNLLVIKFSLYPIIKQRTFSGWHSENHWGDISNLWADILPDLLNWIVEDFQISVFANIGSRPIESPYTTSNLKYSRLRDNEYHITYSINQSHDSWIKCVVFNLWSEYTVLHLATSYSNSDDYGYFWNDRRI